MIVSDVDFCYLSMPEVTNAVDGSQDALVVRVSAGGYEGWGECEAAPLPSIAAFVCPASHGACRPVSDSVLGAKLDGPEDIARMSHQVGYYSMDLLQAAHTWSGIEMALWDLLGQVRQEPTWALLGHRGSYPKRPYASVLFGVDPDQTQTRAKEIRSDGFRAAKFGWAPFGSDLDTDIAHIEAARAGLGADAALLIDAGQIFGTDVDAAAARIEALVRAGVDLLEEPFRGSALNAYAALADRVKGQFAIAAGESAHSTLMAQHMIDYGKLSTIQIDCGRIGGLGAAMAVVDHARENGIRYINHTFTSSLALSASLQPFAGVADYDLAEYPTGLSPLAEALTVDRIRRDPQGFIAAPEKPGLGVQVDERTLEKYALDVRIEVGGRQLFPAMRRAS